ncbi:MAG: exodeoxyribonuclease beta chain, partial [Frankiales bacterium]|nr:exodeoxyribonuclease beta chain [Frankiales bacterium]
MAAGVFDLYGPLPSGTTVLEASAGTGKTYTIAALATRYVAEGVADLSQLMLVTFGRAATQELRDRTRRQLTDTARGLADPESTDPLVRHLAALDREGCRHRLVRALSDFDAATITTTHSFCQRMLDGLGVAGEREPGVTLTENVDELVGEVVDDLYLRSFAGQPETPPKLTQKEARAAALSAVHDRDAVLEPADAALDTAAGQRVAIARAARREVERRKHQHGIRDFDDLLHLLRDVLADPVHGEAACARIRSRFRVVLVDEFQDTDPVQWEILRRAFHGHTTLILIGDPKQAIYAFRGAEVLSYLDAVRVADVQQTLATNYRSDAALLSALEQVYGGAE